MPAFYRLPPLRVAPTFLSACGKTATCLPERRSGPAHIRWSCRVGRAQLPSRRTSIRLGARSALREFVVATCENSKAEPRSGERPVCPQVPCRNLLVWKFVRSLLAESLLAEHGACSFWRSAVPDHIGDACSVELLSANALDNRPALDRRVTRRRIDFLLSARHFARSGNRSKEVNYIA